MPQPQQQDSGLRRIGRGGAGNHRPAAADEGQPPQTDEGQPPLTDDGTGSSFTPEAAVVAAPGAPGPLRGGRGGAGNFVEPSDAADGTAAARTVDAAALAASRPKAQQGEPGRRRAMAGRGGAGNWPRRPTAHHGDDDDDANLDEWDEVNGPHAQRVEALERKVKEAVDKGLRMPDKVHHGEDRGGYE